MIQEYEPCHGAVFTRLFNTCAFPISVLAYPNINGAYALKSDFSTTGLYIKYSSKRLSPWRFTFLQEHQDEIAKIKSDIGELFLALVCGKDGIVILSYKELKYILDETHELAEWVSVARGKRQMYLVKGKDGALDFKVGQSDFPKKIHTYLGGSIQIPTEVHDNLSLHAAA